MDSDLKEKIKKLHLKYVPSPFKDDFFDLVWTHSQIVGKIAQQLADNWETKTGNNLNREMVELGALVHDIGVYQCDFEDFGVGGKKASYICHGVLEKEYGEWHKKFDGFFKRLQILFILFFKSISLKL